MLTNKVFLRKTKRGNILKVKQTPVNLSIYFLGYVYTQHWASFSYVNRSSASITSAMTSTAVPPFAHAVTIGRPMTLRWAIDRCRRAHSTRSPITWCWTRMSCWTRSMCWRRTCYATWCCCRRCWTRWSTRVRWCTRSWSRFWRIANGISIFSLMNIISK